MEANYKYQIITHFKSNVWNPPQTIASLSSLNHYNNLVFKYVYICFKNRMFLRDTYHPEVKRRLLFVSPEEVVYEASICKYIFIMNTLCKSYDNKIPNLTCII